MHRLYISVVFLFISITSLAQDTQNIKGKITGKVTDAVSAMPVDFATVSIFKEGATSPFNGISTDQKGVFTIKGLPAGEYRVTVDFLGYQLKTIDHVKLTNIAPVASLGNILLSPTSNQLADVAITARRPIVENKIDKMIYNTANDLTAQGGVAVDVLKKCR
jgi:ferric enterobactin receptor